jgi:hypothetical protein
MNICKNKDLEKTRFREKRREESEKEKSVDLAANQSKVRVGLTFFNHKYMVLK